jgi:hypothetical protein
MTLRLSIRRGAVSNAAQTHFHFFLIFFDYFFVISMGYGFLTGNDAADRHEHTSGATSAVVAVGTTLGASAAIATHAACHFSTWRCTDSTAAQSAQSELPRAQPNRQRLSH